MTSLKRPVSLFLLCLFIPFISFSQENKPTDKPINSPATPQSAPSTARPALEFGLSEDTPVKLKLTRTMSSKDAKVGEKVDFEVLEDVKVKDVVVIRQGATAIATVTKAQPKRSMGRAGKLDINIDYVQLVSGDKVPLRATKGGSGGSHTGAMTGAMVATGILFFPAAPLFLFMKGKNINIAQGTEVTAYVAGDSPLDPAKFLPAANIAVNSGTNPVATANASVAIKSTPEGADITVDDKFIGTTPSTIQLIPGDHRIVVAKNGFKSWERTITISSGGLVNVNAELEKLQ